MLTETELAVIARKLEIIILASRQEDTKISRAETLAILAWFKSIIKKYQQLNALFENIVKDYNTIYK